MSQSNDAEGDPGVVRTGAMIQFLGSDTPPDAVKTIQLATTYKDLFGQGSGAAKHVLTNLQPFVDAYDKKKEDLAAARTELEAAREEMKKVLDLAGVPDVDALLAHLQEINELRALGPRFAHLPSLGHEASKLFKTQDTFLASMGVFFDEKGAEEAKQHLDMYDQHPETAGKEMIKVKITTTLLQRDQARAERDAAHAKIKELETKLAQLQQQPSTQTPVANSPASGQSQMAPPPGDSPTPKNIVASVVEATPAAAADTTSAKPSHQPATVGWQEQRKRNGRHRASAGTASSTPDPKSDANAAPRGSYLVQPRAEPNVVLIKTPIPGQTRKRTTRVVLEHRLTQNIALGRVDNGRQTEVVFTMLRSQGGMYKYTYQLGKELHKAESRIDIIRDVPWEEAPRSFPVHTSSRLQHGVSYRSKLTGSSPAVQPMYVIQAQPTSQSPSRPSEDISKMVEEAINREMERTKQQILQAVNQQLHSGRN